MRKRKFYFKAVCIGILCMVGLSACEKENRDSEISVSNSLNSENTLVVYFAKENPFYQFALEEYQKTSKTEIDLHVFDTEEELAKQYAAEGMAASGADVVLCGNTSSLNIKSLASKGVCLDLTQYFNQDQQYQSQNYYEVVVDAGKIEGKQYVLPITYDLGFVVVREAVEDLCGNVVTDQTDCYTFYKDLLTCQEILHDSEEIRLGLCFPFGSAEENLLYAYHVSGLHLTDGSQITADKEKIQILCDFIKADQKEWKEKFDEMKNSGQKSALLTGYQLLNGNPAANVRRQEYAYEALFDITINYAFIPSESPGKFHATVRDFGFVSAKSDNQEQAYQLLRYIMDYNFYKLGVVYDTGVPINQNNFENQFQELCNITEVTMGNSSKQVLPMSEDFRKRLREQMTQIDSASLVSPDEEKIFAETMIDYINETADFEDCYQQMCSRLDIYLRE